MYAHVIICGRSPSRREAIIALCENKSSEPPKDITAQMRVRVTAGFARRTNLAMLFETEKYIGIINDFMDGQGHG